MCLMRVDKQSLNSSGLKVGLVEADVEVEVEEDVEV